MKIGKNTLFYFIALSIFFALKHVAVKADISFFYFLLKPVTGMIEVFSGCQSKPTLEGAFLFSEFNILIDISCSGFNFFLLCFGMFVVMLIRHFNSSIRKLLAFPISLAIAYLLTIFVNTSRILVAILIQHTLAFDHPAIHLAIGVFIYLSSLIISYHALHLFLNPKNLYHAKLA